MKIRALTLGISIGPSELLSVDASNIPPVAARLSTAVAALRIVEQRLKEDAYDVQTTRISLNSFEEWLPIGDDAQMMNLLTRLNSILESLDISFCSIGTCRDANNLRYVPAILTQFPRMCCSFSVTDSSTPALAEFDRCHAAAETTLEISRISTASSSRIPNFAFCASFNCPPNIPFFPAAYHRSGAPDKLTVGLENGDLLFIAFHGVDSLNEARENLKTIFPQVLSPLDTLLRQACCDAGVEYGGIDASINPGLTPQDSVAMGLENLIQFVGKSGGGKFGADGTMSAIAVVTSTLKALKDDSNSGIKLCGYCGVMLPVMEDLQLAARAAEAGPSPTYSLRDLVSYAAVCGVGLDTVPIPALSAPEALASLMSDLGAIAFRHSKALSCRYVNQEFSVVLTNCTKRMIQPRVFPIPGAKAGDITSYESPYLCNTRVFDVKL
jgi:hypothetical protein